MLLVDWALLDRKGDQLRPTFPILDSAAGDRMAPLVDAALASIEVETEPLVRQLVTHLQRSGAQARAYALLFSYVLDGNVWRYLDELELIPRRGLDRARGLWGGEIWAYVPRHRHEPESSSLTSGEHSIRITRLPEAESLLEPLVRGKRGLRSLFPLLASPADETAVPAEPGSMLERFGVVDGAGGLRLTVVDEIPGERLYRICNLLTTAIAQGIAERLDRATLAAELGLESEQQAVLVAYYQVMWGLMDRWVASGAIELPPVVAGRGVAQPADTADLLVLVRRPTPESEEGTP